MSLVFAQNQLCIDKAKLILFVNEKMGLIVSQGEGYRTQTQQNAYFYGVKINNAGNLEKARKLTRTQISKHQSRLAFDLNFFKIGNDGEPVLLRPDSIKEDFELMQVAGKFFESLTEGNNSYAVGEEWDFFHFEHKRQK